MTVKKILKIILCIFGALVILLLAAVGFFVYLLDYQVRTVDQAESPDGTYELLLQSVGSPLFFSSADGRLVLKQGKEKIAERDFTLYDDGGSVRADIWQVTWLQEFVRIRISGSEQNDEWIEITYDGKFFSQYPARKGTETEAEAGTEQEAETGAEAAAKQEKEQAYGEEESEGTAEQTYGEEESEGTAEQTYGEEESEGTTEQTYGEGEAAQLSEQQEEGETYSAEELEEAAEEQHMNQQLKQLKIKKGYRTIYDTCFQEEGYSFTEDYDAKGNSRAILKEDENSVEYLVYDRESQNGLCGLYVYYRAPRAADGSWSPMDAEILDIYAYVYAGDSVISSGKTGWSDAGSEEYRDATGE